MVVTDPAPYKPSISFHIIIAIIALVVYTVMVILIGGLTSDITRSSSAL